ncbi:MAG: TetR/AcrR family transcriptional regulator [Clostridia bacterium]|nr:TetR/AcrR family transcriptional regulator [Clostridia bacterium]
MPEIRIPTQKRSIEKRNKIIEEGFNLMCENGYFNTSTPDIAKAAGVSTGIIYQYFKDKKDIFIEGVKNYAESIMFPMVDILENENIKIDNLDNVIKSMINIFIKKHNISKKAHEELMAMSHLDEDISNIFKNSEIKMTEKIVKILENNDIKLNNPKEKIHIIVGIIDNFCHEIVYHKHSSINYEIMQSEVINAINNIIK